MLINYSISLWVNILVKINLIKDWIKLALKWRYITVSKPLDHLKISNNALSHKIILIIKWLKKSEEFELFKYIYIGIIQSWFNVIIPVH